MWAYICIWGNMSQRSPSELCENESCDPFHQEAHMVPIHSLLLWVINFPRNHRRETDLPTHESTRNNRSGDGRVKLTGTESTVSPGKSRFLRRRSIYHKPQPGCSVLKSRKHNFREFFNDNQCQSKAKHWSHCTWWLGLLGGDHFH